MRLEIHATKAEWWLWVVTLVLICAALSGWSPGYRAVMLVSALQVVWFAVATGSLVSFPAQVRLVYVAVTLVALWTPARAWVFAALALGTFMVTAFDRCAIALALARMPWNRGAPAVCELPPSTAPKPSPHGRAA
jgi:hypothetical protein